MTEDLPPSAKYVRYVVDHKGPLTQADLREETGLPARTLQDALGELRELDEIRERPAPDTRQRLITTN